MARRRYRRRGRRNNQLYLVGAVVAVAVVAVIAVIIAAVVGGSGRADDVTAMSGQTLQLPSSTDQQGPMVELPAVQVPTAAPTVMPTAVPTAAPTVMPTVAPATAAPTAEPAATFEYLPVIKHGSTEGKRIAITVDDCFQMNNLKTIAMTAYNNGGKLTLFPIGENVVRDGMADVLKTCVFQMGFEIENHTWSHARVFRLSEEEMAQEIWQQSAAVSLALGVNYQQHFFRLMGGDGEYDQRTHNYLEQLGYRAIADWSISGSDATMDQIKAALKPGAIYLFHTTDADTQKLLEFIPYAVSQGYELVTLNELCGLEENATSDISTLSNVMPEPREYRVVYQEQKQGDYSWAVVRIQQRLAELGYLDGSSKTAIKGNPADGVYGESTTNAIARFQKDQGLPATGVADVETQTRLLGQT